MLRQDDFKVHMLESYNQKRAQLLGLLFACSLFTDLQQVQVELAKGGARRGSRGGGYGGGFGGGISRRSKFRVRITGLPGTCSWQDLKDFMRKAGDVTFANVSATLPLRRNLHIP